MLLPFPKLSLWSFCTVDLEVVLKTQLKPGLSRKPFTTPDVELLLGVMQATKPAQGMGWNKGSPDACGLQLCAKGHARSISPASQGSLILSASVSSFPDKGTYVI